MVRSTAIISSHISRGGFTIAELTLTILIMVILLGMTFGTLSGLDSRAQDAERASDATIITQDMERYYKTQASSTGATYPSTATNATAFAALIDDVDATIAPAQTTNSIVIATSASAQTPPSSQYVYQPLNLDGSLCTATPCVRFKVYYTLDETGQTVTLNSMRQQ